LTPCQLQPTSRRSAESAPSRLDFGIQSPEKGVKGTHFGHLSRASPSTEVAEPHGLAGHRDAIHLGDDYEAVKNSLIYPEVSNGPLEGVNSRIKMKHRHAGERAEMELLNAYNVLRPENLPA